MAKSVGKYTGLGYRPLQGDIVGDIINAEDQEFRHRAEDRLEADRRAKAKADKEAARQKALGRVKNVDLFDTGSDSLNATLAETIKIAQQEYPKIFEILDNPDRYSLKEQTDAQLKLNYLNEGGLVNDLKIMTSAVMKEAQDYETALSSNQIFRNEDFERKFENGFKGITISVDDNLRPVILFKGRYRDQDNDGILDVETMDSLTDVYARPQFQRNVSWDSALKQHADKYVVAVNQQDNGVTKTKITGINANAEEQNLFEKSVKRVLYNDDGTPTEAMLAFARQRNLDPNVKVNLDKIESDYKSDLQTRLKREKLVNVDGKTALDYRKYNDEKGANGISYVESKQYGNTSQATAHRFAFNTPYVVKGTNKSDSPKTLTEIRYDQQNGNVVLIGTQYAGKTTTKDGKSDGLNPGDYPSFDAYMLAKSQSGDSSNSTVSKDNWEEVTITDKAEVTSILSKVMGVNSYDEIVQQLKPKESEEQKTEVDEFGIPINN